MVPSGLRKCFQYSSRCMTVTLTSIQKIITIEHNNSNVYLTYLLIRICELLRLNGLSHIFPMSTIFYKNFVMQKFCHITWCVISYEISLKLFTWSKHLNKKNTKEHVFMRALVWKRTHSNITMLYRNDAFIKYLLTLLLSLTITLSLSRITRILWTN